MIRNGFGLTESLLSLLILLLSISLLITCITSLHKQKDMILHEKIEKEWFYSD